MKQNKDHFFNECSFLNSFQKLTDKNFIKDIEKKSNIIYYQSCSNIVNDFKKNNIYNLNKDQIKFINNNYKNINKFIKNDKLNYLLKNPKIYYELNLYLSFKNYLDYLNSNEEKLDKYIIPLLLKIYPIYRITW